MRLGFRLRLFVTSAILLAIIIAALDAWVTRAVTAQVEASIDADLRVRAALVARAASLLDPKAGTEAWDALADQQGAAAEARVTFIDLDGRVLGDSEVATADVPSIENHGSRGEVRAALRDGEGQATRLSSTVNVRMTYVAVPVVRAGSTIGVARLAESLEEVERAQGAVRSAVLQASAFALALALATSLVVAHRLSTTVEELRDAARKMTEGDLDVRTRLRGADELAELGRGLDGLAESLQLTLARLRAERDLLGGILEGMQEGVVVIDRDGSIVLVNAAFRAMVLLPADATGKQLIEVVRHAALHDLLARARRRRSPVLEELDLPGLKPRRLLVHAARLDGAAGGVLAVLVDVTDLRRLESLRRDFVANVSHELRTPVAAVRSAAETLAGGALDDREAAGRFVDIVVRNAERLQNLIEDLLELSRIESKELRLKKERVDLPSTAAAVLALFRERAERGKIPLRAAIDPAAAEAWGDARAVEQILSNLVDNAVKYGRGAAVVVSSRPVDGGIELQVTDSGPGIAVEHHARIFERFYRVDPGRSRDLGGTGLGLSIVKHLAEALGGGVEVESAPDKGTTFTVKMPRPPA